MQHETLWRVVWVQDSQRTIITSCTSGILANMQRASARKVMAHMGQTGIVEIVPPKNIIPVVEQVAR